MVLVSDRSAARGKSQVRSCKPSKKVVAQGAGQTNGRIRLKLCGLIATISGLSPFEYPTVAHPSHVQDARA